MERRDFLKTGVMAAAATTAIGASACAGATTTSDGKKPHARKHWFWINPRKTDEEKTVREFYTKCRDAGIGGILFESDSEMHYRIAKELGMEAHRWMWTVNRGEKTLLEAHPEWYAVSRLGDSCADKPPYVGYYRWLCPSREEVRQYLSDDVKSILSKDYIDGIHLDYVRFCDVILPVNLWSRYGIVQKQELPEYDFCYCDVCKKKFLETTGQDVTKIEYPEESLSWRQFRYDAITELVNRLADDAKVAKKPITAAVFPAPELARRIVRQDWTNWPLDGVFPMIYHGFYRENVRWIGTAVAEGVRFLDGRFPLYAGIFLPDFADNAELEAGMKYAIDNGAAGISLFGRVTDEVLTVLKKIKL